MFNLKLKSIKSFNTILITITNKNNWFLSLINLILYFQGVYKGPGFDLSLFEKTNFPKSFFYGIYKFHMFYSRSNEIFGCQVYIIEVKRR